MATRILVAAQKDSKEVDRGGILIKASQNSKTSFAATTLSCSTGTPADTGADADDTHDDADVGSSYSCSTASW